MNSVDIRYQASVAVWNAERSGISPTRIDYLDNWWEISLEEAAEFGITPQLNNPLCLAYTRYLNLVGVSCSGIWSDQDRQLDRGWYGKEYWMVRPTEDGSTIIVDCDLAARFMSEVCNLPISECVGYILFITAAMQRTGLYSYEPDEPDDGIPF